MPRQIVDAPIKEFFGQQITALQNPSTTAANRRTTALRRGFREILVRNTDVTAADDLRWAFLPKIAYVFWYDDSQTKDEDKWIDLLGDSKAMLDSAQTGISQFTLATADFWYIATTGRHGGFKVDVDGSTNNSNGSAALTGEYSRGNGFLSTAITDGTDTGSTTPLAQDGPIEIDTAPADGTWQPIVLNKVVSSAPLLDGNKYYWFRFSPLALLTAVEIEQLTTLVETIVNDTGDSEAAFFANNTEYTTDVNDSLVGGIEYWATGGDVIGHISWIKR